MQSISPSSVKEELRHELRVRRSRLPEHERQAAASALAGRVLGWLADAAPRPGAGCVAAYLSAPPEPGTDQLLPGLVKAGYDVVVPVCEPQYQLSWTSWKPDVELAKSPRAPLWEPVGARHLFTDLTPFTLVLVPGLAMDLRGSRIGQGGGYYDRFLATLTTEQPGTPTFGYLYDEEILPAGRVPATILDIPLPGAFSPSALHMVR